jgi:hypothetical protein
MLSGDDGSENRKRAREEQAKFSVAPIILDNRLLVAGLNLRLAAVKAQQAADSLSSGDREAAKDAAGKVWNAVRDACNEFAAIEADLAEQSKEFLAESVR